MTINVFLNEIVQSTGYMDIEKRTLGEIRDLAECLGYVRETEFQWSSPERKIYVRLVDDISSSVDLRYLKPQDVIITDNYINHAVSCETIYLPNSWWGMYAYRPEKHDIQDLKDYSFLVNRVDESRLRLLLVLFKRKHLHEGVINFNCSTPADLDTDDVEIKLKNWADCWEKLGPDLKKHYAGEYQRLTAKMPFCNHGFTHEQALWASRLNIVVETYSSDDVIAFSEKIFAALCVPRAWTLFGGRYSVARLRRLGFDVLDDLVDHSYDYLTKIQDKYPYFVECCLRSIVDPVKHRDRLEAAALHNQNILHWWKRTMDKDFQSWLDDLEKNLKIQ